MALARSTSLALATCPQMAEGGNGVERWGDYSAAEAAPDGSIWMSTEYISGRERTSLANWSTFITHVVP